MSLIFLVGDCSRRCCWEFIFIIRKLVLSISASVLLLTLVKMERSFPPPIPRIIKNNYVPTAGLASTLPMYTRAPLYERLIMHLNEFERQGANSGSYSLSFAPSPALIFMRCSSVFFAEANENTLESCAIWPDCFCTHDYFARHHSEIFSMLSSAILFT